MIIALVSFLAISNLFGVCSKIDAPQESSPKWVKEVFGISHEITLVDQSIDEMVGGLIDNVFDKDFIKKIQCEAEKNGDGEYIEYWPNEQLKAKIPYKDRKAHGHVHGWYENGDDAFKGHFCEGVKQGVHITFYRGDNPQNLKHAKKLEFLEDGTMDRDQNIFDIETNHRFYTTFKQGKLEGSIEAYDKGSKPYLKAHYKKGKLLKAPPRRFFIPKYQEPIVGKYIAEVQKTFIKKAMDKYDVIPRGTHGRMADDIQTMGIELWCKKRASKKEAYKLLIDLMTLLSKTVNEHEKIRPYLREYPFPIVRSDITLEFMKAPYEYYKDGSISYITVNTRNQLAYYYYDPDNPETKIRKTEPFLGK